MEDHTSDSESPRHSEEEIVFDTDEIEETLSDGEERSYLDEAYVPIEEREDQPDDSADNMNLHQVAYPLFDPIGDYFETLANDEIVSNHLAQATNVTFERRPIAIEN